MKTDKITRILALLEKGSSTDSAQLKELEKDLIESLHRARNFGIRYDLTVDWNASWCQQLDIVEGILRRIRALVNEMDSSIESSDSDRLKTALEAWRTIQSEDTKMVEALSTLRTQANGLNEAVRKDWNLLACKLNSHLETIHACAQALRIKLELKEHSKEEVTQLVQDILSKLPNRSLEDGMDAETYERELDKAAIELGQEQHQGSEFIDVVKAMFMWVETPSEERVRKNPSLPVNQV